VAAAVVGGGAVAVLGEEDHLILPGVGVEGPAVAEDDGPSFAPVLKIDLRAVLRRDGVLCFASAVFRRDGTHRFASFVSITPRAY
jgi:hypothetical protein